MTTSNPVSVEGILETLVITAVRGHKEWTRKQVVRVEKGYQASTTLQAQLHVVL